MKELLLFRHAKSSWNSNAPDDFSRPLNQRGIRDAQLIGRTLRDRSGLPQCIHLSSSVRTSQTCDLFLQAAQLENMPCHATQRLYHAGLDTLSDAVRTFDDRYQRVMLIGHNPGLEALLLYLCPDTPFMASGKLLTTANVAVLRLAAECWQDVDSGSASLFALLRPKELVD